MRPNDKARYYPLVACCGWGFGIILVALVGLIGTHWTHFIYIIGVLCFFLGCFIISLPRSFVWLFSRSRNEEGRIEIIEKGLNLILTNFLIQKLSGWSEFSQSQFLLVKKISGYQKNYFGFAYKIFLGFLMNFFMINWFYPIFKIALKNYFTSIPSDWGLGTENPRSLGI